MLKTSARRELALRFAGLSLGSSTRESTFWSESAVSAAIVMMVQQTELVGGSRWIQEGAQDMGSKDGA